MDIRKITENYHGFCQYVFILGIEGIIFWAWPKDVENFRNTRDLEVSIPYLISEQYDGINKLMEASYEN